MRTSLKFFRNLFYLSIFLIGQHTYSQDQNIADSLKTIYQKHTLSPVEKLHTLREIAENELEVKEKLRYSTLLIKAAQKVDSPKLLFSGYIQTGNALRLEGDLSNALDNYFKAAQIAEDRKLITEVGVANITIADAYSIMGNHNRSISYYRIAIKELRAIPDSIKLGSALLNTGDEFFMHDELDSALVYFRESGKIFENKNYQEGLAYNLGNTGLVFAKMGNHEMAEKNLSEATHILEKNGDFYPICVFLIYMSEIYFEKDDLGTAIDFAQQSLELSMLYGFKDQISDANLKLSQLYEASGQTEKSYQYYKDHITYRDSVRNLTSAQEMAGLRADNEVFKKQAEIGLLNEERKNQKLINITAGVTAALIAILAVGLYRRNRFIKRTSALIENEKNRSDRLLLNILPEETAKELKDSGSVDAKKFEMVSVIFADFKGFTKFAENLPPEKLIKTVDFYFSKFDEIMAKYKVEKIKTMGDCYMAVAGLPFSDANHAQKAVAAAFEILDFVKDSEDNPRFQYGGLEVRVGIHSGAVVAGVVGTHKFAYDIWGDTVNIASRMQTSSETGKINISESTHDLICDHYDCTYRGEISVKNRGMFKMYFIEKLTRMVQ
ncbi:adenylate/guanylate cyclase domain-containing protein [Gramella sp. AN32]|uniref:Adenylate/guanylate cyclase domain-containing protein n=1 Tax=Christiangramia antarctica TaxID=2058158 RepID=A0ABW5X773_9FLAO|nr:adenylate/guanylate cyclase domain-containing protein [Gramella sp. AN32]MCM4155255.1 adenylate/guanylate cyclase domain-containing protein [Gramella sp. AN32]